MKKHEASQHTKIEAWMRHFLKNHTACKVELKHTRGNNLFYFSDIKPHQYDDLEAFDSGVPFVHKFDDVGYRKKPCDFIGVAGGYAFVAIRYPKSICILSYNVLVGAKRGKVKSLCEKDAKDISYQIINVS